MSWTRVSNVHAAARVALMAALAVPALAPEAFAQAPPRDAAMAETLFADAKKKMTAGDYAGACPELEESYRLDPGGGTLTALALCHEHVGKTASAWAEFIQVVNEAQQAGRADREKFARQHVATIEPTLSRLTINVAPETAKIDGVAVRRDKVVVGQAAWGVASPVDPGDHVIEASAPGKQLWSAQVKVTRPGESTSVAIPVLVDAPETEPAAAGEKAPPMVAVLPASEPAETPPAAHSGGGQRTAGVVVGITGLAALGVGSYFGAKALSQAADANRACSLTLCTNRNAVQTNNDAKSNATAADVILGAGLLAVGVGVALWIAAPGDAPPSEPAAGATSHAQALVRQAGAARARPRAFALRVVPTVTLQGGGARLEAAW